MECSNDYILEVEGLTKQFPGVLALNQVQLKVKKGTVHAVMGENGAGKSTMMKVLLGLYKPDAGTIRYRGKVAKFNGPSDALKNGIAMIHQELSTVLDRTVAQNIFLNREILYPSTPILNQKAMHAETKKILARLGIGIEPNTMMKRLTAAQQQLCEIAKAVALNADLIIMDEPTSSIGEADVKLLFQIIRDLRASGVTILYISHKLDEVFEICDEVSVYRDGCHVNTVGIHDVDQAGLIKMMVGREITDLYPRSFVKTGDVVLRVENLSCGDIFHDISFELHRGEILGVAGLVGAGRSEVMETIYGIRKKTGGNVYLNGKLVQIRSPRNAIKLHIGFLTEDRKRSGCFLCLNVLMNIYIAAIDRLSKFGFLKHRTIRRESGEISKLLNIKMSGFGQRTNNLSGGNQQKVLIARWLMIRPDILIVDEPTRGIDVGSKYIIHELLNELAAKGTSIIMVSSEMPEVMGMSNRIIVLHEGEMMGVVDHADMEQERLMRMASGIVETE